VNVQDKAPLLEPSDAQNLWNIAYNQLQLQFDRPTFDTWIKSVVFVNTENDGKLYVMGAKNNIMRDMLQHRLYRNIRRVLSDVCGYDVELRFEVHAEPTKEAPEEMPLFRLLAQQQQQSITSKTTDNPPVPLPLHQVIGRPQKPALPESELNSRYRFERFIVTSNNRIAYEAAQAVVEAPGRNYNPFFVYGGVGLGKTHLLQAVANACAEKGLKVLYIPSEVFTNDLIASIRNKTTAMFREKYRGVDVLLVDDVQFIAGKDSTQEEFFHTFNALMTFNKQIVIASDRHPSELTLLEDRLKSRFQGGLVTDVQPLDYEARIALLQMWGQERGVDFEANVYKMIAKMAQTNVRELEGMFNQMVANAKLNRGILSIESAARTILKFDKPRVHQQPKRMTVEDVITTISKHFDLHPNDLMGKSRAGRINTARQIAMYLARELTDLSLPQIGEVFNRSHTTILHGYNKINDDLNHDTGLRHQIESLKAILGQD
jgi:chromosomal replication initiator protein